MRNILITFIFLFTLSINAQTDKKEIDLPFSEIGEYPADFSQANIISRMIEGLGYRYYWATKSLTENDLNYKPKTTISYGIKKFIDWYLKFKMNEL